MTAKSSLLAFLLVPLVALGFDNLDLGTPSTDNVRIIDRVGFASGFSEQRKQPLWVTYKLTREEVKAKRESRKGYDFAEDPELTPGTVNAGDYRRSGYSRGHMAPAADMGWSPETMRDSFYYTNICPQDADCNGGVWADIEQKMRYWATIEGEIQIVTGPIFGKDVKTIGTHQVAVPEAFYKVVYAPKSKKCIGFIVPNKPTDAPLKSYTVTVDKVEKRTGLDVFSTLPDDLENKVEATFSVDAWKW